MPSGINVRPQKWDNVNLYDDGEYSAIWGRYEDSSTRCLGVRWNGAAGECGYPSQGGNPLWYVELDFTTKEILLSLLHKVITDASLQGRQGYQQNILTALSEFG
jgi:hypothetical protein